ncbi:hypothetical protein [Microbacterium rhizomatis]|uniref:Secreted protein n=1 Tax=Microbacterium rhizomatis TaxID=1631477 RepID=A0A5J5J5R0_9MICO|nr:hypothetical protein [Microbacterium rhizomatis]KAA9110133.1 hypothetical protein F6B43_00005 [Microbacterium rhizomatis]
MGARMRLAVGGVATVAASIAVVCAVAVTNSAALADSAGTRVALARIDVPAPAPSAMPSPAATTAAPATPDPSTTAPSAETVPAPAPEDVAPSASSGSGTVSTDASVPAAPTVVETPEQDFLAGAAASGGWDRLVQWARTRGWSDADIARWVARNHDQMTEFEARWRASQTPAPGAGSPSDSGSSWSRDGSKKDQSPSSPDRRG